MDEEFGWFVDFIYKGDYSASMRVRLGSFFLEFIEEECVFVKGSVDYFVFNYYMFYFVKYVIDV